MNVVVVAPETVDEQRLQWGEIILWIEVGTVVALTAEYVSRMPVADLHLPLRRHGPVGARLGYILSRFVSTDIVAIAPFYATLISRAPTTFPAGLSPHAAPKTGAVFTGAGLTRSRFKA